MRYEQESLRLTEAAARIAPEAVAGYLEQIRGELLPEGREFAAYMRGKLREKGILQQEVFLAADLSENYGYKLIAQEKHTRNRNVILRLCIAARLTPEETREALTLYGMAPLHGRIARDVVLLSALAFGLRDVHDVDALLRSCGLTPLMDGEEGEPDCRASVRTGSQ
ncbi:MAG: hypothetical protein IJH52_08235 [Oscillospiraceae bacterium]|nr:hypothetical protein [Oscillospiraceae bacterium]